MNERTRSRGYTAVELMMALTVLAIGVSGVIAMQKVTVVSNQHAKNLALATHLAESWAEQLSADATRWNFPNVTNKTSDLTDTFWLNNITANANKWVSPAYQTDVNFGPAFDALGNVVAPARAQQTVFCTHIRLSWLYPDSTFNGLMRADIRVFWPREGRGAAGACTTVGTAVVDAALENYHFVHYSTAIRQYTSP
jgi:prepilin-type N-terminal cleavage/methylation domain-containing protein